MRSRLEALGAAVVELPSIAIEPLPIARPDPGGYAWIVFTSVNGVDGFFDRALLAHGLDSRALGGCRVAAIGPGTAAALGRRGIVADLVPERFVAESLIEAFPPALTGERVLLARAETARDALPEGLARLGYVVEVLPVYRTVTATPDPDDLARVQQGDVDALTFTASSTVDNFCELVGAVPDPSPLVVSIGPITSDSARRRGLEVDAEADPHTIDGLVTALLGALAAPRDR